MGADFALRSAPTNEIAAEYTIPVGLATFALLYILEKITLASVKEAWLNANKYYIDDGDACTEHAERILKQGRHLGIKGTPIEVFDGNDERDIDTSHTIVRAKGLFGRDRIINKQQVSNHGDISPQKLKDLEEKGMAQPNTEINEYW